MKKHNLILNLFMNKNIFSENCNLRNYTTIKVGGVAEYFAEPRNIDEFSYLIKWANLEKKDGK